jgi:hypothetical protein
MEKKTALRWRIDNAWAFVLAQAIAAQFLQSFRDFPPRSSSTRLEKTIYRDKSGCADAVSTPGCSSFA